MLKNIMYHVKTLGIIVLSGIISFIISVNVYNMILIYYSSQNNVISSEASGKPNINVPTGCDSTKKNLSIDMSVSVKDKIRNGSYTHIQSLLSNISKACRENSKVLQYNIQDVKLDKIDIFQYLDIHSLYIASSESKKLPIPDIVFILKEKSSEPSTREVTSVSIQKMLDGLSGDVLKYVNSKEDPIYLVIELEPSDSQRIEQGIKKAFGSNSMYASILNKKLGKILSNKLMSIICKHIGSPAIYNIYCLDKDSVSKTDDRLITLNMYINNTNN